MSESERPSGEPPGGPVGSLGDEAAKLLGALGAWARDQQPDSQSDSAPDSDGADCTWCPVCRTVHALRHTSPEVRDQLVVAATALLQIGTSLLAAVQAGPTAHRGPDRDDVEHIDLSDRPGADLDDADEWES